MATAGLVSVVVPCFNAAAYLDDALRSARGQTYAAVEVVAVDDGSTDDSRKILAAHAAADPRVRVFGQPNRGVSAARNAGIRRARGEFLCFLDADDVFLADKVDRQVGFLQRHPECDLVYSDSFIADQDLNLTGFVSTRIPPGDLMMQWARRNCFGPSVMAPLARRELIDKVGQFEESLHTAEDWDYWIRCAKSGAFGYLPGAVAVYRKHASQTHLDGGRMLAGAKRVLDKHFRADAGLYGLALACFYWSGAKRRFRAFDYPKVVLYLVLSEYYSRKAGGVPLSAREVDTVILPVAAAPVTSGPPADGELIPAEER